jgi:hypothetical protein
MVCDVFLFWFCQVTKTKVSCLVTDVEIVIAYARIRQLKARCFGTNGELAKDIIIFWS